MLLTIISPLIWGYIALSSPLWFVGGVVLRVLSAPFDHNQRLLHLYTCFWAGTCFYFNPVWRLRIHGAGKVDRHVPYVMVINHQSLIDILAIFGSYLPFKWVSKAAIFKVPFIGWNCTMNGYVPLLRGDKESIKEMYDACRRWLDRGASVAMFPEGTRTRDGNIQDFKVGAFRIAREAKCKVLPIVLDGTDALPKHGFRLRQWCRAEVRVLDPLDVSGFSSDEAAAEAVRGLMVTELERMRSVTKSRAAA